MTIGHIEHGAVWVRVTGQNLPLSREGLGERVYQHEKSRWRKKTAKGDGRLRSLAPKIGAINLSATPFQITLLKVQRQN